MKSLSSKEFFKDATDDQRAKILNTLKTLGKYKKTCGEKKVSGYPMNSNLKVVTMLCEFENSKASVILVVGQENGKWLISKLRINSKFFLKGHSK